MHSLSGSVTLSLGQSRTASPGLAGMPPISRRQLSEAQSTSTESLAGTSTASETGNLDGISTTAVSDDDIDETSSTIDSTSLQPAVTKKPKGDNKQAQTQSQNNPRPSSAKLPVQLPTVTVSPPPALHKEADTSLSPGNRRVVGDEIDGDEIGQTGDRKGRRSKSGGAEKQDLERKNRGERKHKDGERKSDDQRMKETKERRKSKEKVKHSPSWDPEDWMNAERKVDDKAVTAMSSSPGWNPNDWMNTDQEIDDETPAGAYFIPKSSLPPPQSHGISNKQKGTYSQSADSGGFHATPKSRNAEALAKFVARRKTMSPSSSVPVFKSSLSDTSIGLQHQNSGASKGTGDRNGVDWKIGASPDDGTKTEKKTVKKHNSDGQLRSSRSSGSGEEPGAGNQQEGNKHEGVKHAAGGQGTGKTQGVDTGSQTLKTTSQPGSNSDTDSVFRDITLQAENKGNQAVGRAERSAASPTSDRERRSSVDSVTKTFTKKPLSFSLDFDLSPPKPDGAASGKPSSQVPDTQGKKVTVV